MQIGRLSSRCVLQQPDATVDALGQPVLTWTDVATVWGDIRYRSGMETIKAGSPVSVVQASIRIRYRSDITAGMRVVHNLVVYSITAVLPDAHHREYLDLVTEVVA